jgi:CubicO group peptidase (beta-lactamase class C family)
MKRKAILAGLLASLALATAAQATDPDGNAVERQVDTLFAPWTRPGTPGAVVEIIHDGKVVLSKGYGLADVEHDVPMTPATVMIAGSMSKQFTAFAIQLLAQDGKLTLDDDIRAWMPEVPDFGKRITIRHLLHHTSGLRDYFLLLAIAGAHGDDVVTQEDALALVARQHALNFAPGAELTYSNTGYLLLGVIVERVSGKPLADFARERIFTPLGMMHTRFLHGYGTLVPGRAPSYVGSAAEGYRHMTLGDSADGAGGVVTTAGDLALWDRNFYDGRVGGMALIERMQAVGVLNDGKPVDYASGLMIGEHHGRRMVWHSGSGAGYQTMLARFPDQHLSVVVLANAGDVDVWQSMPQIVDLVLDGKPVTPPAPPAARREFREIAVDPASLEALTGTFALSPQYAITFTREDGHLMAQGTGQMKIPAYPYGERAFFARAVDAQFTFDPPGKDGIVAGGVLHRDGVDTPARRVVRPVRSPADLHRFEGMFYSDELGVVYTVTARNGRLMLAWPRGTAPLDVDDKGETAAGFPFGDIRYRCGAHADCSGFTVNTERVRGLEFTRIAVAAAGAR